MVVVVRRKIEKKEEKFKKLNQERHKTGIYRLRKTSPGKQFRHEQDKRHVFPQKRLKNKEKKTRLNKTPYEEGANLTCIETGRSKK